MTFLKYILHFKIGNNANVPVPNSTPASVGGMWDDIYCTGCKTGMDLAFKAAGDWNAVCSYLSYASMQSYVDQCKAVVASLQNGHTML